MDVDLLCGREVRHKDAQMGRGGTRGATHSEAIAVLQRSIFVGEEFECQAVCTSCLARVYHFKALDFEHSRRADDIYNRDNFHEILSIKS